MKRIIIPPGVVTGDDDLILEIPVIVTSPEITQEENVFILDSKTSNILENKSQIINSQECIHQTTDDPLHQPSLAEEQTIPNISQNLSLDEKPLVEFLQENKKMLKKNMKVNKLAVTYPTPRTINNSNHRLSNNAVIEPNISKKIGAINTIFDLVMVEQSTSMDNEMMGFTGDYTMGNDSQLTIIGYEVVSNHVIRDTWTDKPYLLSRTSFLQDDEFLKKNVATKHKNFANQVKVIKFPMSENKSHLSTFNEETIDKFCTSETNDDEMSKCKNFLDQQPGCSYNNKKNEASEIAITLNESNKTIDTLHKIEVGIHLQDILTKPEAFQPLPGTNLVSFKPKISLCRQFKFI